MTFNKHLQGLRAVAVMFVLLAHADLRFFSGGFVGVDIFFVLSGYLITGLLLRELDKTGEIVLVSFFARRIKRLLPALALVATISYCAAIYVLSSYEAEKLLSSAPFVLVWSSNLYFYFSSFGYFDDLSGNDLFLHTWSLAVEEQFYLVWPLVILLTYKLVSKLNSTKPDLWTLSFKLFLVLSIFSFILSVYWTAVDIDAAFYMMPSRIWQFSLGSLAFLYSKKHLIGNNSGVDAAFNKKSGIFFVLGMSLLILCLLFFDRTLSYPGLWALVPSFATVLIILSCQGVPNKNTHLLSNRILIWFGDRSYSIYLWHWPIFVLGSFLGVDQVFLWFLLTFILSDLSYRFFEYPFWKGRLSKGSAFWLIFVGVAVSLALSMNAYRGIVALEKRVQNEQSVAVGKVDMPPIYTMGCDDWYASANIKPCVFGGETNTTGEEQNKKLVVLIGDSIGAQWFSAFADNFVNANWTLLVLTKSACPMVDEDIFYERIGKVYDVCSRWREAAVKYLAELKPHITIVGSSSSYEFNDDQWYSGSTRVFEDLSQLSENVLVVPGTPSLEFDGPSCLARKKAFQRCHSDQKDSQIYNVEAVLKKASEQFENVDVLGLNDLVCPNRRCSARDINGTTVFRDTQHLSDTFVKSLSKEIAERLKESNIKLLSD